MPWPAAVVWAGSSARWQALRASSYRRSWAMYRCRGWWRAVGAVAAARLPTVGLFGLVGALGGGVAGVLVGLGQAAFEGHTGVGWLLVGLVALPAVGVSRSLVTGEDRAGALHDLVSVTLTSSTFVVIWRWRHLDLSLLGWVAKLAVLGLLIGAGVGAAVLGIREFDLIDQCDESPLDEAGETVWSRVRTGADPAAATQIPSYDCWGCLLCPGVVIFCAAPVEFTVEAASGLLRLHRADGPAVRWPDGSVEYWWHGTQVPAGVPTGQWSARQIRRIGSAEVRRAAIEMIGWPEFIHRAKLRLVAAAADPGNPGRQLRLYDLPYSFAATPARLLLMTNGRPDRDGRDRTYAEAVPRALDDPVAAAAWRYGVPTNTYRQLQRRT